MNAKPLRFSEDPRGYMARKNRERRTKCIAAGICPQCATGKPEPGRKTCKECMFAAKLRNAMRRENPKKEADDRGAAPSGRSA